MKASKFLLGYIKNYCWCDSHSRIRLFSVPFCPPLLLHLGFVHAEGLPQSTDGDSLVA